MAVRTVQPAVRNAVDAGGSGHNLVAELVDIVNELSTAMNTLTAKIDADAGDTGGDNDYASTVGTMDTLAYSTGNTPT